MITILETYLFWIEVTFITFIQCVSICFEYLTFEPNKSVLSMWLWRKSPPYISKNILIDIKKTPFVFTYNDCKF